MTIAATLVATTCLDLQWMWSGSESPGQIDRTATDFDVSSWVAAQIDAMCESLTCQAECRVSDIEELFYSSSVRGTRACWFMLCSVVCLQSHSSSHMSY